MYVSPNTSTMGDTCLDCGKEYKRIATHWSNGSCERPSFSDKQREIITGLLMGDGCVQKSANRNPQIIVNMTSKNYLKYIDSKFGIFGKGVSITKTARKSAKENRDSGFDKEAKEKNYSDVYRWTSMRHPELEEFRNWYSTGKKVWPKGTKLTPTVLKHWYCGDGTYVDNNSKNYIRISMSNEVNNTEKVSEIFESSGLPSPSSYTTSEREDGSLRCAAQFTVSQSESLWEYMGTPLPDFEYKWPKEYQQI